MGAQRAADGELRLFRTGKQRIRPGRFVLRPRGIIQNLLSLTQEVIRNITRKSTYFWIGLSIPAAEQSWTWLNGSCLDQTLWVLPFVKQLPFPHWMVWDRDGSGGGKKVLKVFKRLACKCTCSKAWEHVPGGSRYCFVALNSMLQVYGRLLAGSPYILGRGAGSLVPGGVLWERGGRTVGKYSLTSVTLPFSFPRGEELQLLGDRLQSYTARLLHSPCPVEGEESGCHSLQSCPWLERMQCISEPCSHPWLKCFIFKIFQILLYFEIFQMLPLSASSELLSNPPCKLGHILLLGLHFGHFLFRVSFCPEWHLTGCWCLQWADLGL